MVWSVLVQMAGVLVVPWLGALLGVLLRPVATVARALVGGLSSGIAAAASTFLTGLIGYGAAVLLVASLFSVASVTPHWAFFAVLLLRRVLLEVQMWKHLRIAQPTGMGSAAAGDILAILLTSIWYLHAPRGR